MRRLRQLLMVTFCACVCGDCGRTRGMESKTDALAAINEEATIAVLGGNAVSDGPVQRTL